MLCPVKVLLIDDDEKLTVALRRGLEAVGYAVEIAHTGDEGLWLAAETSADVIVLDVMLPGVDGFEVCRRLRDRGDWIPILMLTAKDAPGDEADGLDTGADDYLVKPFALSVLLARLRALLRRASGDAIPPVTVGDLRIDPGERRVWRDATEIDLTARQFDVLEFLVRRSGQVVSKADVLAGVWPHDFDGDPNIVEVYVGRLRRAVDDPFDRRSIETVRGAGYRIVDDGGA